MKGLILAGGSGSRLYPLTETVNKQLLPVHDKPMIYYPLTTLIAAGISDICIITNPAQLDQFKNLLGNGERLGVNLHFRTQKQPNGIPEAFIIAQDFIQDEDVALILGDNIFVDSGEIRSMVETFTCGAAVLGYQVVDPARFGVIEFDVYQKPVKIVEKPESTNSKIVVPGLYVYDSGVCKKAKALKPSSRGELEITDLNNVYLGLGQLTVKNLSRGSVWIDAGTPASISRAGRYIATIEENHGMKIGCPEEAALVRNFISKEKLKQCLSTLPECDYKNFLTQLLQLDATKIGRETAPD